MIIDDASFNRHPRDPSSKWDEEILFTDGDHFFSKVGQAFQEAKTSIDLETYIFDLDALGIQILKTLADAAARGVRVRLLLDGIGSSEWSQKDADACAGQGIQVRFFHPLPWQKHHRPFWKRPSLRWIIFGFRKLNHRDHRKLYVVDGTLAFVGSMNVSARHLRSLSHDQAWRDTSASVRGSGIEAMTEAFEFAWRSSEFYKIRGHRVRKFLSRLYPKVLLKDTDFRRKVYYHSLVQRVCGAKQQLWITNPYFVPNPELLQSILDAASAGADVRLLFPKRSDFFGVKYAMESFYLPLLLSGARIFEYLPAMLHAKIMIVDGWVTIGSSNLDHRSLFQDLEVDIVISHPENCELLEKQFLEDLKFSEELHLSTWIKRPLFNRLLEKICYRFRTVL